MYLEGCSDCRFIKGMFFVNILIKFITDILLLSIFTLLRRHRNTYHEKAKLHIKAEQRW